MWSAESEKVITSNKHEATWRSFLWMKLIICSFGKESNDMFPVFQDGYDALAMDSASLLNSVSHLETTQSFENQIFVAT